MKQTFLIVWLVETLLLSGFIPEKSSAGEIPDAGKIVVKELQCEYAVNPLGIDTPQPRFTWLLESPLRGQIQTAYQILVASNKSKLQSNIGDKWDSGKVVSDHSVNIVYQGKPLSSGEKCYWKIRVWDKDERGSLWSETAFFEMGLLNENDWQGQWISMSAGGGPEYVPGKFAKAVAFNRKDQTIQIPHYKALKPNKQITINAWIKPHRDSGDQWQEIYRKEDGDARCLLAVGKTGDQTGLWFGLGINGKYTEECGPVPMDRIKDGNWYLVTATYDGRAKRIYLDGKEIKTVKHTGRIDTTGDSPAYIGSYGGQKEFFQGLIDDVAVYNVALNENQIQELIRGIEINTGMVGRWKLDGDLNNSVNASGNGTFLQDVANNTAPLLRKEFAIDKPIQRARVYFAGLGFSELYINGNKVGDDVLSPAFTDYYKRIQYVTYDMTDYLKPGRNALGIILGNGWFSAPINDWKRPWSDRPKLILQLNIEYTDGSIVSIVSDRSWKGSPGPIENNNIEFGEVYDARKEQPGWCIENFNDAKWQSSEEGRTPGGKLISQIMPSMQVIRTIKPIKLTQPKPKVYVYEFDHLFGGWARMQVKGPRNTKVRIEYSSRILESGLIDKEPWPGDQETDFYILKGDSTGETYEPRFTFHPVQYVQISGYPGKPTLESLEGRIVYTNEDLSGLFECSNPLFNRIHDNVERTLKNALKGFLLDCMHREPIGYNEPASVSASLFTRKHMPGFWNKYAEDIKLTARDDGSISDVAPVFPGMVRSPDVAQGANYPMLIWYLYQTYDDRHLLENHYPAIKGWVDYITNKMCDGPYVVKGWLGDHMLPGHAPGHEKWLSDETPSSLIWTALYYRNLLNVSDIAKVLSKNEDAQHYSELAKQIKQAFNDKWLDHKTSNYGSKSQTSEILPVALGLVPEAHKGQLLKNITHTITQTDKGHLRVGHAGVIGLIESLTECDLGEIMYDIVNQTTYPGWGYMVAQGASTVWECWGRDWASRGGRRRADSMTMLAGVNRFFYNNLAGIQGPKFYGQDIMKPGFKEFHIKPYVLGELQYVRAAVKTVRGTIRSAWERKSQMFELRVEIPVNCKAKIYVPKFGLKKVVVTEKEKLVYRNNRFLANVTGITAGRETDDYIIFDSGSGSYEFRLTVPIPKPIDRYALVTRHNIILTDAIDRPVLQVGNGEIAFGVDATGLQTFYGNTLAQWGWHTSPLPEGLHIENFELQMWDVHGREVGYPTSGSGQTELYYWLRKNPHRLNLGRIGLKVDKTAGGALIADDLANLHQQLDLWSGIIISRYQIEDQPVEVIICAHPTRDAVAVRIASPLLAAGRMGVTIAFPYGNATSRDGANWSKPSAHQTIMTRPANNRAIFARRLDADDYYVMLNFSGNAALHEIELHTFELMPSSGEEVLEFVYEFSPSKNFNMPLDFGSVRQARTDHWPTFWKQGRAIDLSDSKDPRWKELERRIVLSQYLLAVNEAGSLPPQESGLLCNSHWYGKFHLEMHW